MGLNLKGWGKDTGNRRIDINERIGEHTTRKHVYAGLPRDSYDFGVDVYYIRTVDYELDTAGETGWFLRTSSDPYWSYRGMDRKGDTLRFQCESIDDTFHRQFYILWASSKFKYWSEI